MLDSEHEGKTVPARAVVLLMCSSLDHHVALEVIFQCRWRPYDVPRGLLRLCIAENLLVVNTSVILQRLVGP